jgi:hypothetical protein
MPTHFRRKFVDCDNNRMDACRAALAAIGRLCELDRSMTDADRAVRRKTESCNVMNHYGSCSRRSNEVAAVIYALIESVKLAGVSPEVYLLAIAERALDSPGAALLPVEFKAEFSKS